jgi:AcrR family transcriptional regulator
MAKPKKTRERILDTSLALFNRDGEPNVTTVDIANELDISPGNLYYHFHGKDELVGELFARFHAESLLILREPQTRRLAVEEYGYYLVVVFEHIHAWRFLYRDIALILQRYEAIQRPFRRLIRMKQEAARTTCLQLREAGMLQTDDARIELLARSIALTLTHWLDFEQLLDGNPQDERSVYGGVLQVAALIAPYLGEAQQAFMDAALALASPMPDSPRKPA